MLIKEKAYNGFLISTDKSLLNLDYVHEYLSVESYWAQGVTKEIIKTSVANSLCFGVYDHGRQIGFARLVTDYATFGYLADVFIDEAYRKKGISKQLMEFIFEFEELKMFRRIILATRDAHGLYLKYGFTPLKDPSRFMEKHQPGIYKTLS
jgi:GNAT superfamily N-acetyltransferase